jgi:hypothetical protein
LNGATHNLIDLGVGSTSIFSVSNVGVISSPTAIVPNATSGLKIANATSQSLSFWNKTPIIQPTTAITGAAFVQVNTTTPVSQASTFGGYTLQQIAAALINVGILA